MSLHDQIGREVKNEKAVKTQLSVEIQENGESSRLLPPILSH